MHHWDLKLKTMQAVCKMLRTLISRPTTNRVANQRRRFLKNLKFRISFAQVSTTRTCIHNSHFLKNLCRNCRRKSKAQTLFASFCEFKYGKSGKFCFLVISKLPVKLLKSYHLIKCDRKSL